MGQSYIPKKLPKYILCYVEGCWAYFTTGKLEDQWGDDWNDAPYEHNAGSPYNRPPSDTIIKIGWDGPFDTPADLATGGNSVYSVEDINKGAVAWLKPHSWLDTSSAIKAGTTVDEFTKLIEAVGGHVYIRSVQGS